MDQHSHLNPTLVIRGHAAGALVDAGARQFVALLTLAAMQRLELRGDRVVAVDVRSRAIRFDKRGEPLGPEAVAADLRTEHPDLFDPRGTTR